MGGVARNRVKRTDRREFPGLDKLWRHGFDRGAMDRVEASEQGRRGEENLDMRVSQARRRLRRFKRSARAPPKKATRNMGTNSRFPTALPSRSIP